MLRRLSSDLEPLEQLPSTIRDALRSRGLWDLGVLDRLRDLSDEELKNL